MRTAVPTTQDIAYKHGSYSRHGRYALIWTNGLSIIMPKGLVVDEAAWLEQLKDGKGPRTIQTRHHDIQTYASVPIKGWVATVEVEDA